MIAGGAGRPIHVMGTATTADFQEYTFGRASNGKQVRIRDFTFQTVGANNIRLSFDAGVNWMTFPQWWVFWEEYLVDRFWVQSVGGDSNFEVIATEV